MLFNSLDFALFFPFTVLIYFALTQKLRNAFLLAASCFFYMVFIPKYILIMLTTILIDYFAAILISNTDSKPKRKYYLIGSIVSTCLVLFIFKYYNFFAFNTYLVSKYFSWGIIPPKLTWLLPIGLSFHTFQSLSYVIEVYRKSQKAEKNFLTYALYVIFFPTAVAGPIERPQNLLHQFYEKHLFNYEDATSGLKLIAWGLFKKVVIADRLASTVNLVFGSPQGFVGGDLILAVIFFSIQIYCDFSGYTDMAIGSARVLGFKLTKNFDAPYQATSVSDFWKRWHISLSSWFRDYVYISLGGNRVKVSRLYLNIMFTFVLSGFWHGANFTFLAWGALNGLYLIAEHILNGRGVLERWSLPAKRVLTFTLISFAWVLFRAKDMTDAGYIWANILTGFFEQPLPDLAKLNMSFNELILCLGLIVFLEGSQYQSVRKAFFDVHIARPWFRWASYYAIVCAILFWGVFEAHSFIYFQF